MDQGEPEQEKVRDKAELTARHSPTNDAHAVPAADVNRERGEQLFR